MTHIDINNYPNFVEEDTLMGLLNATILNALESLKVNYKPALAGEIYYANGCGCTGNCGQSCSGGCEAGCSGNCGRSCSGSGS